MTFFFDGQLDDWDWEANLVRRETGLLEAQCPHGYGHPLKASIVWMNDGPVDYKHWGVHGCDGCCSHARFPDLQSGIDFITKKIDGTRLTYHELTQFTKHRDDLIEAQLTEFREENE
jgi:hypothetical protein